jgi:hypothetical protein
VFFAPHLPQKTESENHCKMWQARNNGDTDAEAGFSAARPATSVLSEMFRQPEGRAGDYEGMIYG